ncbi:MAG: hypothetical protein K1X75_05785 [Leptospirales bacterium]|nr:hypothetical protein [Leptospirales bacterium]
MKPHLLKYICTFIRIALLATAPLAFVLHCSTEDPIYQPPLRENRSIRIVSDSRAALFSFAVRSAAGANSQGRFWTARRNLEQATVLQNDLAAMLGRTLGLQWIPDAEIKSHSLYIDGRFPVRARYFLNPSALPLVQTPEEEDLMLRTSTRLQVRYFANAFFDHSVSKFFFFPASVKSRLVIQLYSAEGGLLFREEWEEGQAVEPYERTLWAGSYATTYEPRMNEALAACDERLLQQAARDLAPLRLEPSGALP